MGVRCVVGAAAVGVSMKRFLEKYLKVYRHEVTGFIWIGAVFFLIFFVTAIFRTFVDAAFLKRYGPEYIPWMLVINALLTFVVFGAVDRLARRYMDYNLLSGFLGIYAASVVIIFFMIKSGFTIVYPILYQLLYLLDSILLVYLWNMAGDLFDTRQGKRIFPLITSSQVLGTTLGSFATKPITIVIGEDPTLLVFGAVCFITAVVLATTGPRVMGTTKKYPAPSTGPGNAAGTVKLRELPAVVMKYPIIRYLIVTGLIPNILLPIFFYQFSVIVNHRFASEEALISFLSVFRGMITMLTFVLLFFVGRLYSRIGLTSASLIHPVNFAVLFGGLAAFWNIYVACYGQFTVILIQRAIAGPVNKVLYNVVPQDLMAWSRTFIRGTVLKVGMLIGSVLMIVLKPVIDARYLALVAMGFAVYWLLETILFRKLYRRILKQVIVEKEIDFDQIDSVRTFDSGGAAMEIAPVSVEERSDDLPEQLETRPSIEPDLALKLLEDPDPRTRADAVGSFAVSKDPRAVRKLIFFLNDPDGEIRGAAIDALVAYKELILPYLEVALIDSPPRLKQGILEVLRLSELKDFEMAPFLAKELFAAYGNLLTLRRLKDLDGNAASLQMLRDYIEEDNDEILRLIFYALWVCHADMRLIYQALKSETASIAVEMVEDSIDKDTARYLIPLIEDLPLDEKIERARKLLPLMRNDTIERLLTFVVESDDIAMRLLGLYVIGDQLPLQVFVPVIQSHTDDAGETVREMARYALARTRKEEVPMPEIIEVINNLKIFDIFQGMGVRELYAISTVLRKEKFAAGDVMIMEGEENASIYLVIEGNVRIVENYGSEGEREKLIIGKGSFLGELSMFTRLPPSATCIASEDTKAYVLPHHQFIEIMRVYPQIGINLCRFFSIKCRQMTY